jgi:hypothetical protein
MAKQELVEFSLEPKTLDEAMKLAELIAKSDLVPNDYKGKAGNVLIAVQMGREVGLKPMQALQNIAVINGRPCMWGDALLAVVYGSGTVEDIREDFDARTLTATFQGKRKGQPSNIVRTFSKADAEKARLWNKAGTWQTNPKRMLQLRARAFGLRDGWADVLKGMQVVEEQVDVVVEPGEALAPPPASPKQLATPVEQPTEVVEQDAPDGVKDTLDEVKQIKDLAGLSDFWKRIKADNGLWNTFSEGEKAAVTQAVKSRQETIGQG